MHLLGSREACATERLHDTGVLLGFQGAAPLAGGAGGRADSARLAWLRLTGEPSLLTGGRRNPDDENKIIVTRAALALPFALQVHSEGRVDELQGVFSWVATGLDDERHGQAHLDLNAEMDWAAEKLKERMYEV